MCPPCVCFDRASKPCPVWLPLQTPAAMCRSGLAPVALYPPCVGFGRDSKRCVSHVALCVLHVSAPCLFFVLSLSARCSLFILADFQPALWASGLNFATKNQLTIMSISTCFVPSAFDEASGGEVKAPDEVPLRLMRTANLLAKWVIGRVRYLLDPFWEISMQL